MQEVVLFAVGSPVVVDVEESLARSQIAIAAAIQNRDCEVQLLDPAPLLHQPAMLPPSVLSKPFLIPLFTPGNRQQALNEATKLGFRTPYRLIDASVPMPKNYSSQPGLYINSGCSIGAACHLDRFVFINRGVSLGHHAQLGPFVSIGPSAVLGSYVQIGKGTLVGAGSVVLPKIQIGENTVVGAGSVVTKDVPDHCLVLGNPARIVQQNIPGYADLKVA